MRLSPDEVVRLQELCNEAIRLTKADDREALLVDAYSDNPEMLKFALNHLNVQIRSNGAGFILLDDEVPDIIGPYIIHELIDKGGMGRVYKAQHRETEQFVAVKVMKSKHQKSYRQRFRRETAALARMNHPNIATLHEAGYLKNGIPWLAMEYCEDAVSISEYCTSGSMPPAHRIELFLQLCEAVSHAHQNMIVHRDLKPTNVLVVFRDGKPVVKLIDFGILLQINTNVPGNNDDVDTRLTHVKHLVGSPAYMAPEQFEEPEAINITTDVYALGSLLYSLFVGTYPFNGSLDLHTAIVNDEPPLTSASIQPGTPLRHQMMKALRGDLDAIILKALSKKQAGRYPSVAALAADIRNYQEAMPVTAAPARPLYTARKFVRRNRLVISFAASILLTILSALAYSIYSNIEIQRQKRNAERVIDFFEETYAVTSPDGTKSDISVVYAMNMAGPLIDDRFADEPAIAEQIHRGMAETYLARGDMEHAETHSKRYRAIATNKEESAKADLVLAQLLLDQGEFTQVEHLCQNVLSRVDPGSRFGLAAQVYLAFALRELSHLDESLAIYESILPQLHYVYGAEAKMTLKAMRDYATCLRDQGKFSEALPLYENVLQLETTLRGSQHPRTLETMNSLGRLKSALGEHEEAITLFNTVLIGRSEYLKEGHQAILLARVNLMDSLRRAGKYDEAKQFGIETVRMCEQYLKPAHQYTLFARNNLALIYGALGESGNAKILFEVNLKQRVETDGWANANTLSSAHNLGNFYVEIEDYNQAEKLLRKVWQERADLHGRYHLRTLLTLHTLGECLIGIASFEEAKPLLLEAYEGFVGQSGKYHELSIIAAAHLGFVRCMLTDDAKLLEFALEHKKTIESKYQEKLDGFRELCGID